VIKLKGMNHRNIVQLIDLLGVPDVSKILSGALNFVKSTNAYLMDVVKELIFEAYVVFPAQYPDIAQHMDASGVIRELLEGANIVPHINVKFLDVSTNVIRISIQSESLNQSIVISMCVTCAIENLKPTATKKVKNVRYVLLVIWNVGKKLNAER
jgi:hypothetical protein